MRRILLAGPTFGLILLTAAANANIAFAEPRMEIRPAGGSCNRGPFEVFAFDLAPSSDFLVDMVVGGVVTGSVGGKSEPDGRFYSPIPMILLPCPAGGKVTANLRISGQVVVSSTFDVAPPAAATPISTAASAPGAPAAGSGPPATEGTSVPSWFVVAGLVVLLAGGSILSFSHRRG